MEKPSSAPQVAQEHAAQPAPGMGTLDQAGHVCQHRPTGAGHAAAVAAIMEQEVQVPVLVPGLSILPAAGQYPQIGHEGCEGIGSYLRRGPARQPSLHTCSSSYHNTLFCSAPACA